MTLSSGEAMKRPGMLLSEALERFKSLVDGQRLHPAQPLPRSKVIPPYRTAQAYSSAADAAPIPAAWDRRAAR